MEHNPPRVLGPDPPLLLTLSGGGGGREPARTPGLYVSAGTLGPPAPCAVLVQPLQLLHHAAGTAVRRVDEVDCDVWRWASPRGGRGGHQWHLQLSCDLSYCLPPYCKKNELVCSRVLCHNHQGVAY